MAGAPGWYWDPNGSGRQFFWNGSRWSVWTGSGWAPGPALPPPTGRPIGARKKSRAPWIVLACGVPVVLLAVIVAAAGQADGSDLPDDQQRFLAAVDDAAADYKDAGSGLQRSLVAKNAPVRWCSSLSSGEVRGWVGKVKAVDNTLDYGTLRIDIGDRAEVRTTSNFLFDRATLIQPGTPLYDQISRVKAGQKVRFYGNFVADSSTCIRETSVTESGQTESPDFLFKFTYVEPE